MRLFRSKFRKTVHLSTESLEARVDRVLVQLAAGKMKCQEANVQLRAVKNQVPLESWHQYLTPPTLKYWGEEAEKACGLYNLLGELLAMTSFDNKDRQCFDDALCILREYLKSHCMNPYWGKLVNRRGPIESLWSNQCSQCGFSIPGAGISGFLMEAEAFCESCGAMVMFPMASEECERLAGIFETYDPAEREQAITQWGVRIPSCMCGGRLIRMGEDEKCPRCRQDKMVRQTLISYEYFQSHKHCRLQDLR